MTNQQRDALIAYVAELQQAGQGAAAEMLATLLDSPAK